MPSRAELMEAKRQLSSLVSKLEKTLPKLEGMKPQRTLALRRLDALRLSLELIERELGKRPETEE